MKLNTDILNIVQALENIYILDDTTKKQLYSTLSDMSIQQQAQVAEMIIWYQEKQAKDNANLLQKLELYKNKWAEIQEKRDFDVQNFSVGI